MDKFRQYKNYAIIGVISLFCLFFLPFTGSTVGMGFNIPDSAAGWLVFIVNKLIIAVVNFLILYCFVEQGKYNVRNDERYLKANELIMQTLKTEKLKPKSPRQHSMEVYGKKGTTIFLTSILGLISLGQAVIVFDWITMLTYFFVLTVGIIFGVIQMGAEEEYWTDEYLKYATLKFEEIKNDKY